MTKQLITSFPTWKNAQTAIAAARVSAVKHLVLLRVYQVEHQNTEQPSPLFTVIAPGDNVELLHRCSVITSIKEIYVAAPPQWN